MKKYNMFAKTSSCVTPRSVARRTKFEVKDVEGNDVKVDPAQVARELERIGSEVKEFAKEAQTKMKESGDLSAELKESIDNILTKQGELIDRMGQIEQKAARRAKSDVEAFKTIGQQFVESEEFKGFASSKITKRSTSMSVKAVTNITSLTTGTGAAGDGVRPERLPQIYRLPERQMTVRDLITPGRTNSNTIEYVKETGFQNSAAIVAEGAAKPQSDIAFDLVQTTVATIAHWAKASNQIIADFPQLESFIDGKLTYGLKYVEEQQLLNGSGSGGNLNGIYTQATAYAEPAGGNPNASTTAIDIIRLALLQAELAEYPSTGIVLNPTQWCAIELTKDSQGRYIIGNPQGEAQARLWGRPVVTTQAMANDKFLVGAFRLGAQVFDREDANVQISTEDGDNFTKNMVTIRCEERLGLAVYRPEAFIKGDLGYITA